MSAFYASKLESVAAAGEAHNEATRKRYPQHEDLLGALNTNIKLALIGEEQVMAFVWHGLASDWAIRAHFLLDGCMQLLGDTHRTEREPHKQKHHAHGTRSYVKCVHRNSFMSSFASMVRVRS